ncbi:hypothetical protein [Sulfuricurvum sp.]|uniref:hypothetical protein n=1 Tax=Sulfuricurvum sp. TaxID=2025608 RepID=UPI003567A9F1
MVKVAILHEGNAKKTNDNELLKLLIEKLGFSADKVEFFGMGTKSNFFKSDHVNYRQLQSNIDAEMTKRVLFVVDADYKENDATYGGYENTTKELKSIIDNLGLTKQSDIYVTCDEKQCGYLESLILSTIPDEHRGCIETFLECSEFTSKENHKAILNQIYKTAYPKAPFDLEHPNFTPLKTKLINLFQE